MFPVYCYLSHFRFLNPRKRIHNPYKHPKSGRLPHYPPTNSHSQHYRMSSSNLNTLLKTQIRAAIEAIYSNQGTNDAHIFDGPASVSKALLDLLFPEQLDHNAEVTGVIKVPTVAEAGSDSEGSTESKKERKKRAPMSDEAKAQMKAKREATIAAKKTGAPAEPAPPATPEKAKAEAPTEPVAPEAPGAPVKERKARGPMSDEAKAAMKAKREATIAAKKAAV